MRLSQALKEKNRLAGQLVRQNQIVNRENSRRSDSVSKVDREAAWNLAIALATQLGTLKGKIAVANVGIYPKIEQMSELKARIGMIESLQKREGPETDMFSPKDKDSIIYQWDSYINQQRADELIATLQMKINELQDEIDTFNATTSIA